MFEPMTEAARRELYLLLSRAAVEFGREEASRLAASRVLTSADPETLDHRRARLYLAAADSVHPERVDTAVTSLRALKDEGGLDPAENTLLDAALDLARSVQTIPDAAPAPTPDDPASLPSDVDTEAGDDESDPFRIDPAIAERVDETIAAVDALLERRP